MDAKGAQSVQDDRDVDCLLKHGPGERRQITECRGAHRGDRQAHARDDALNRNGARAVGDAQRFGEAVQPVDEQDHSGGLG